MGGSTQVTRTGTQAHTCREHQAGSPPAAQQYECRVPMGFGGLGRGCSQARTHKPSPKTSRCGWHSTEGQTGPCSRLARGGAASLPWPHTTPGREAQPHEVPPPLPQPSCQLPSAAGPRCPQHCAGEREHGAKRDHSEGRLPAMASSTCSHRTEDISLFVQVFSFASPEWNNICFVYNPQASP